MVVLDVVAEAQLLCRRAATHGVTMEIGRGVTMETS